MTADYIADDYEAPHHLDVATFVDVLASRPRWWLDALCRGTAEQDPGLPEVDGGTFWFPTRGESTEAPKAICATCPVIEECREFAISHISREGVWGGLSERQRRYERHRRHCDGVGCDNRAHYEVPDAAPDWVPSEFKALWRRKRAPRRATFGSGSREAKRLARQLAAMSTAS